MGSSSGANPTPTSTLQPASPQPATTTGSMTGTMPPALPIALKVSFTLNTPDGLREISFGLEKDTDGVSVNWTITFVLYERSDSSRSFGDPVVSLNVFVASGLHANAESAAHIALPRDRPEMTLRRRLATAD